MNLLQKLFAYIIYFIWKLAKLVIILPWKLAKLLVAIPKIIYRIFMRMKGVYVVDGYRVINNRKLLK